MLITRDEVSRYAARLQSLDERDLHSLRALLSRAVNEGVTPGISLWIAVDEGGQSDSEGFSKFTERSLMEGRHGFDGRTPFIDANSLFDLASLTKPLVTARWCAELFAQGSLDRDLMIGDLIQCEDLSLAKSPLWRLLNHSSGLPAHREYFKGFAHSRMSGSDPLRFKNRVRQMIRATSTEYFPGEKCLYSDLGYLLLETVCEQASGMGLREAWDDLHPSGELHFRPLSSLDDSNDRDEVNSHYVPTELCSWRKRLLSGEVHDDNAWLMGGVCGHAGLFGSARSVAFRDCSLPRL